MRLFGQFLKGINFRFSLHDLQFSSIVSHESADLFISHTVFWLVRPKGCVPNKFQE